jgi:hypothetical protein
VIRRLTIALCALLGAASLTACSTFDRNDLAASVGDSELSQDEFGVMIESELGIDLLNSSPANGLIDGGSARSLLGAWIGLTALDQAGLVPLDDRDSIVTQLETQFGATWTDAPAVLQDLVVLNVAVGNAVQAGELAQEDVAAAVAAAEVFVDSRYGAWSGTDGRVLPLG